MHRSGTTLLAQFLCDCGIYMGRDMCYETHAESRFWRDLNQHIMRRHGGEWDRVRPVLEKMRVTDVVEVGANKLTSFLFEEDHIGDFLRRRHRLMWRFGLHPPRQWGWKDPRNSITLPVWLAVFPRARVIHVIRNGIDSAISLHRRETKEDHPKYNQRNDPEYFRDCFRMWEDYVHICIEQCRALPERQYFEVRYEDILRDPEKKLQSILSFAEVIIGTRRLREMAGFVNSARLDNSRSRKEYHTLIKALPNSFLLEELGYE